MKVVVGGAGEPPTSGMGYCIVLQPKVACHHYPFDDTAPAGQLRGRARVVIREILAGKKPLKALKDVIHGGAA